MKYLYSLGFILGTFKFLFSHWTVHLASIKPGIEMSFFDLFIPTTSGALITMFVFYFSSNAFMKRAAKKRAEKYNEALSLGLPYTPKKKFTFVNKKIVQVKRSIGIHGVTIIAPLFLSIPLGAIVCAKFYRHQQKTFPFMVITVVGYSALMSALIKLFFS
jgi:hypothetical protein